MHITKFKKIIVLFGGPILGSFLLYTAYMMLTDIPDRNSLMWLNSSDVKSIKFIENNDMTTRIRFNKELGCCISVSSKKEGFSSLLDAAQNGKSFSIGYNKERALFSESSKRYTVIYEIIANGNVVLSYDKHVRILKYIFLGAGALGLFMLCSSLYFAIFGFPNRTYL